MVCKFVIVIVCSSFNGDYQQHEFDSNTYRGGGPNCANTICPSSYTCKDGNQNCGCRRRPRPCLAKYVV